VTQRGSQLVLGVDPDPAALWPAPVREGGDQDGDLAALGTGARAVLDHCRALIEATAEACVAVKLQLASFEALGAAGRLVLDAVAAYARGAGLLVIADGKRGDIDVSARAYASALFGGLDSPLGRFEGLGADAATVNPLMGRDAIEPFIAAARREGAGVFLLVRTSNPGAADVEDLALAAGGAVWERLAALVAELGEAGIGEAGLSDVGAVMGATAPAHLRRARELMPGAVFLLPGIGAQGGAVEDLAPAFLPGAAGGLITASRSIAGAHQLHGGSPAQAARAEAERLRASAWSLSERATA
jgi:orotidine-5'-phosphate decarboxylase